ncbi:MAG: putative aspartokinase [Candidatus Heimdallarchaeota archaeon LC_3]|nr:MAG: putative aspartokinase [Candidatus Heimdallarchaeota archaeon LC_3]
MKTFQIHKFGGSCLRNQKQINHLVSTLSKFVNNENKIVVVVSAIYGVTDLIRYCIENLFKETNIILETAKAINNKHQKYIADFPELGEINRVLLKNFCQILNNAKLKNSISNEDTDKVLVIGEKFVSQVIPKYIGKNIQDINAICLTPEELGLITDGEFFNAVINFDQNFDSIIEIFNSYSTKGEIIVVPGFYGVDYLNNITTFGPSGTDYTACALANILNAERAILWKDVNGFMSADPKVVVDSFSIDHLEYNEAAELAHFGAKILHMRAVFPAELKNIPIEVRNMYNSNKTIIMSNSNRDYLPYKSIAYIKHVTLIKVYLSNKTRQIKVLQSIIEVFSKNNLTILAITTSSTAFGFLVDKSKADGTKNIALPNSYDIVKTEEIENISMICIVGKNIGEKSGIATKIIQSISNENVNIDFISAGASPNTLQFTVKQAELEKSVNILHNNLFPKIINL